MSTVTDPPESTGDVPLDLDLSSLASSLQAACLSRDQAMGRINEQILRLEGYLKGLDAGGSMMSVTLSSGDKLVYSMGPEGRRFRVRGMGLLTEAPRVLRIAAVRVLPTLVQSILVEAIRQDQAACAGADAITGYVEGLIAALTPPPPTFPSPR